MAFLINATTVIDNSGNVPWARFTGTPSYISTLNTINVGDGSVIPFSSNVAYSSGTLTIWFDTNCNCICGGGGDGG